MDITLDFDLAELIYKALFSVTDKGQALALLKLHVDAKKIEESLYEQVKNASTKIYTFINSYEKYKFLEKEFPTLFNILLEKYSDAKIYKLLSNIKLKVYRKNLEVFVLDINKPYIIKFTNFNLPLAKIQLIAKLYNLSLTDEEAKIFLELLKQKVSAGEFEHSIFQDEKQELQFKLFTSLLIDKSIIVKLKSKEDFEKIIHAGIFLESYLYLLGNKLYIPLTYLRSNQIKIEHLFYALEFLKVERSTEIFRFHTSLSSSIKIDKKISFWVFNFRNLLEILKKQETELNIVDVDEFIALKTEQDKMFEE